MTLPNLISFSGQAFVGKDAAADVLVSRAKFVKTYMLKPVEQALVHLDPIVPDPKAGTLERFSSLYENLPKHELRDLEEVRRLIGRMERQVGRDNGENLWAELVFSEVRSLQEIGNKVALSGVNHQAELDLVRGHGGVCVWINRPVKSRGSANTITAEDCDVVVVNDGTIKELYANVVIAVEEFIAANNTDRLV